MTAATLECEAPRERDEAVRVAGESLRRGGLVIFPTETVYGVGASAADERGVERLRRIKDRPDNQPFTVHLPDPESVGRYVDLESRPMLQRLVRKTMPGPITLVVDVDDAVIERKLSGLGLPAEARSRLYHGNTIGLRCPDHPIASAVLGAAGEPVIASSANPAGAPPPTTAEQAARALGDRADLILDGGTCRFARASTIVRVRGGDGVERLEVVREGVYDRRYLDKIMQRMLLFICSGNTCRSPMAEAIARHELSRRFGLPPDRLDEANIAVLSAGAFAMPGAAMTPEGEGALRELGIPAGGHTARELTVPLIQRADAIYCMTESHRAAVAQLYAPARSKTHLLDPEGGDIDDPIGAGGDVYVQCAQTMREMIRRRLDEAGLTGPADSDRPKDPPPVTE